MNKIMALVMALIFAVALVAVAGFVISSINGYTYDVMSALPYGLVLGLVIFLFGNMVIADQK